MLNANVYVTKFGNYLIRSIVCRVELGVLTGSVGVLLQVNFVADMKIDRFSVRVVAALGALKVAVTVCACPRERLLHSGG